METPANAVASPAEGPGLVLDGRYRLDHLRGQRRGPAGSRVTVWHALDASLGRPVSVTLLTGADPAARDDLAAAAMHAGPAPDGRFVRVLDAGETDLASGPAAWVASEWVDAPSLAAVVRDEPLPPPLATEIVRQCAEALAGAAEAGRRHADLHPDDVLLPAAAPPRITGLGLANATRPDGAEADDVRCLGALLYAALTGHWPLAGWSGLPGVDARTAREARPRLVRGGISRDLDEVTHRALTGGYPDARALARALGRLPTQPLDAVPPGPAPARTDLLRTWMWRVGPALLVAAVAAAGWTVGSELGRVPLSARQHQRELPATQASGPGHGRVALVWRSPPRISGFDPAGDGEENPDAAGLAVDRDPTTEWTTDTYRGDPRLGGLKPGVGLLLDLRRRTSVSVAEVVLSAAGADVQLRAGNTRPAAAADLPVVASRDRAGDRVRFSMAAPVTARYWLVWFTSLPPDGGGYRIGVAEVALLG